MTAKRTKSVDSTESPPYWAVRYLVAYAGKKLEDAKEARKRLRSLGFLINPCRRPVANEAESEVVS